MSDYALQLSQAEIMRYRMMAQGAALEEREQWTAAGIVAGAHVADIGCGPGAVSAVLAGIVAPDGTVRAVDSDAEALRTAQQLAELAGVANVTFAEGTATESGIAPETVDVVMMRHVLAHNGGQEQPIVDHLTTLVKPGGSVYLVDVDATAMRFHPPDSVGSLPELADAYLEFHARRGNDLSVGLRLGELLVRRGSRTYCTGASTRSCGRRRACVRRPGRRARRCWPTASSDRMTSSAGRPISPGSTAVASM
jgi:ubiquinone/menaquinone biosynthesis C-methylase UbiE